MVQDAQSHNPVNHTIYPHYVQVFYFIYIFFKIILLHLELNLVNGFNQGPQVNALIKFVPMHQQNIILMNNVMDGFKDA